MKRSLLNSLFFCFCIPWIFAQPAPDFTITATDGAQHRLYTDYLNTGKTVVLEIMFTTCPPCNSIAPSVEVLNQDWGAGQADVIFLSLSDKSFDDNVDVAAFEATHGLSYYGAGQDGGSLSAVAPYKAGTYGPFFGTPTFVVIGPDGTVHYNPRGPSQAATIDSIDAAIALTGAQGPITQFSLGGQILRENGTGVSDVEVNISALPNPILSDTDGNYQVFPIDGGSTVSIRPEKNTNHRNGVSLLDIILTQRHLLFLDTFSSPYQYFAADVNRSKSISVTDLVLMQRMILFIDNEFANNTSWRFIPEDFIFFNPNNPLFVTPPDSIAYSDVNGDNFNGDFVAIKVGDVSGNADPNILNSNDLEPGAVPILPLRVKDRYFNRGDKFSVILEAGRAKELLGLVLGLQVAPDVLGILEAGVAEEEGPFSDLMINQTKQEKGKLVIHWLNSTNESLENQRPLLRLDLEAFQPGWLSDALQIDQSSIAPEAFQLSPTGQLQACQAQVRFEGIINALSQNLQEQQEFKAFPNPTPGLFQLNRDDLVLQGAKLELLAPSGQLLATLSSGLEQNTLPGKKFSIHAFPPGLYLLRYSKTGHKPQIIKLVKI